MECFWCLLSHWQQDGDCNKQDPPVFYLYIPAHDGFSDHHLHGTRFLAQPAQVYYGGEKKSVVLSLSFAVTLV